VKLRNRLVKPELENRMNQQREAAGCSSAAATEVSENSIQSLCNKSLMIPGAPKFAATR
jgi:hypothetical protein